MSSFFIEWTTHVSFIVGGWSAWALASRESQLWIFVGFDSSWMEMGEPYLPQPPSHHSTKRSSHSAHPNLWSPIRPGKLLFSFHFIHLNPDNSELTFYFIFEVDCGVWGRWKTLEFVFTFFGATSAKPGDTRYHIGSWYPCCQGWKWLLFVLLQLW